MHGRWSYHFMTNKWGKKWGQCQILFSWFQNQCGWWLQSQIKKKNPVPWKKSSDKPRQCIKKQRHHFVDKGPYSQGYGFSSSHVWMWEFGRKEDWAPKNWCSQTVVLERILERSLDSKEIKSVNPKGNQSWILIRRTDVKLQYFDHLMQRTDSLQKTQMLGKIEGERRRGGQRMVGWHHWLNGHEFEQTQGNSEGEGRLGCWIRHSLVTEQQHEINECEMFLKIDLFCQKKFLSLDNSPWNVLNLPV